MVVARSRITAQGQISVPAEIRRRLGLDPGTVLEWDEEDGEIVVRRAGRFTSEDVHRAVFPAGAPSGRTVEDMKAGIRRHMKSRRARR